MSSGPAPSSPGRTSLGGFLEELLLYRNSVCYDHALTIDHKHTIGCTLVMKHMQEHHPGMEYGTESQWAEEAAYCLCHERDIIAEFIAKKGAEGVRLQA